MQDDDRFIRDRERQELTGVPRSTWARYEKAGTVPKARTLLGETRGWLLSEIKAWMQERAEGSEAA